MDITREELLKLAELSSLSFTEEELADVREQIMQILTYTEEIMGAELAPGIDASRPVNVFRDDKVISGEGATLLEHAPNSRDGYFVVPKIIES